MLGKKKKKGIKTKRKKANKHARSAFNQKPGQAYTS